MTLSFSAPGLVLGLPLLSLAVEAAVATCRCASSYTQLLRQLRSQTYLMKDPSSLLEPYVSTGPLQHLSFGGRWGLARE